MLNYDINILVLEDDPDDALLLKSKISSHQNFSRIKSWVHKDNLADALLFLQDSSVDVILSDLGLSESHGLETFYKLYEAHPEIPIIVLSGFEDKNAIRQAIKDGAQDYLIKGKIEADTLIRSIVYALQRHEATSKLKLILATAQEAFISMDEKGEIIEWNQEAEVVFGWRKDEVIHKDLGSTIIPHIHRASHLKGMEIGRAHV